MVVSTDDVRRLSGVTSTTDVADAIVSSLITEATELVESDLGVSTTVLEDIDVLTGEPVKQLRFPRREYWKRGWRSIKVSKFPLLAVRELKNDTTTITVSNLKFERDTGRVYLTDDTVDSYFDVTDDQQVRIRYLHGAKMPSKSASERTKINEAGGVTKGTSVEFDVDDGTIFSQNDYIWITSMSGAQEATKITGISSNTLTVDELSFNHDDNAIVAKLVNIDWIDQLIKTVAAMNLLGHMSGAKQNSAKVYRIGEWEIQKDFKYRDDMVRLITERDRLLDWYRKVEVI